MGAIEMNNFEEHCKKVSKWIVILGVTIFSGFFFGYFGYNVYSNGWIVEILKNHFAATVSLPMSAIAALFIILTFRFTTGDQIEIRIQPLGVEFEGAAGPVVFWILCFLAFIVGLKLLW
jgi:hypothetical protein